VKYDLLLRNAHLVDPANGRDGHADIGVAGGKVVDVGADLNPDAAARTWDVGGRVVAPGLIDNHMHTTLGPGGRAGFAMLARAGATTAVDFAGPPTQVLDLMARYGSGIAVASLQVLRPSPGGQERAFSSGPENVVRRP
jgi:predicted amidohydrolase